MGNLTVLTTDGKALVTFAGVKMPVAVWTGVTDKGRSFIAYVVACEIPATRERFTDRVNLLAHSAPTVPIELLPIPENPKP